MQPDVPDALVGDAGRLRQVLLNLVGNAIKFTDAGRGGRARRGRRRTRARGEVGLRFAVSDTGIGIPPDKQETDLPGLRAGGHLDHAEVRRHRPGPDDRRPAGGPDGRDDHGGERAGPGQHLRLHGAVRTPAAPHGAGRRPAAGPAPEPAGARGRRQRHQPPHPGGVAPRLADGARRRSATAWRPWTPSGTPPVVGRPYPLVLLDARMPDTDGLALAARIRERAALSAIRIILLTSGDRPGDPARSRELRIDAHLLKPVQQDELLETIYRVMSRARGDAPAAVAAPAREPAPVPVPAAAPLHILVAEDNEFNAQLLEQLLVRRGHRVRLASNGREALALAEEGGFDLLLLDVHMPELDGFQVVQAIRERERTTGGHLPVIALTARSRKEDRERCLAAGMDDFLTKPIRPRGTVRGHRARAGRPAGVLGAAGLVPGARNPGRPRNAARGLRRRSGAPGQADPRLPEQRTGFAGPSAGGHRAARPSPPAGIGSSIARPSLNFLVGGRTGRRPARGDGSRRRTRRGRIHSRNPRGHDRAAGTTPAKPPDRRAAPPLRRCPT